MFTKIPEARPSTPLLDTIDQPANLRELEIDQLVALCAELRAYLLYSVGQTGGHFGAGLGVVELTVALHYLYDTPRDNLVWDVGHQCYPHKIITGRRDQMSDLRRFGGISGFLKRDESPYDVFGAGHSSTSISAALGMALAARLTESERRSVAVIGDGAITAGMAFEALSHAGSSNADLLVILNDNGMSISRNIGGVRNYLARIWASKLYTTMRSGSKKVLSRIPSAWELARRTEEHVKGMILPGTLFEELGFNYTGPFDGHDFPQLIKVLRKLQQQPGPQFLHLLTIKGKGFQPAEEDPIGYHAIGKIEPRVANPAPLAKPRLKYSAIFGQWLCQKAESDSRLVALTPAMCEGSGMIDFSRRFQERFFDVAIAEQHCVTLAAGFACSNLKPVVAIYSTFLQRAYDQLIHDVALQNLDVLFAIDRAGLVGEDGATHAGAFDVSFLRCVPNMVIATPSDEAELWRLLNTGYQHEGPFAVRYPRGSGPGVVLPEGDAMDEVVDIGKGKILREGRHVAILNFGSLLDKALLAAEALDAAVVDMRFAKPLDERLINDIAERYQLLATLEDNAALGGAGSGVGNYLVDSGLSCALIHLGLPDQFVAHASQRDQYANCNLSAEGIELALRNRLATLEAK